MDKIQSRKSVAQSSKVDVLDCIVVTLEVVQFEISALKAEAVWNAVQEDMTMQTGLEKKKHNVSKLDWKKYKKQRLRVTGWRYNLLANKEVNSSVRHADISALNLEAP